MLSTFRIAVLALLASTSHQGFAQSFIWAPEFPVGATIPMLEATDQHGQLQTLETLSGEKGLVVFFNRSFEWCPFCIAQLKDLASREKDFETLGFNVTAMTYDSTEILEDAALDYDISFALLHDEAIQHVSAFGILNTEYEPGHRAYGIPLPGIMVIDTNGVILHKFAEENYRERPDLSFLLEALEE